MKHYIYTAILVVLLASCNKTIDAPVSELSVLAYNQQLLTLPVAKSDGFYFVSHDSTSISYATISSSGAYSKLLDLAGYLPTGLTYSQLVAVKMLQASDNSTFVVCSYSKDTLGSAKLGFSLLKLNAQNAVEWAIRDTLASTQCTLQAVCSNTDGSINVISTETSMGGQSSSTSLVEISVSNSTGQIVSRKSTTLNGKTPMAIYPSSTLGFVVLATSTDLQDTSGGGLGSTQTGTQNVSSFYALYFQSTGAMVSKAINLGLGKIVNMVENNGQFIVSGSTGNQRDGYTPVVFAFDVDNGLLWQDALTRTSKLYVTTVLKTSGGYYLTGAKYDGESFDWSSTSVLASSQMYVAKIDESGKEVWANYLSDEATVGIGIFERTDGALCWLSTKKYFGALNNITLLKTNSTGTIQN